VSLAVFHDLVGHCNDLGIRLNQSSDVAELRNDDLCDINSPPIAKHIRYSPVGLDRRFNEPASWTPAVTALGFPNAVAFGGP
jgi:hypothetical protein